MHTAMKILDSPNARAVMDTQSRTAKPTNKRVITKTHSMESLVRMTYAEGV